jgi:hypothetical protein
MGELLEKETATTSTAGTTRHPLVVRDLATQYQLLALPVPDQTARTTVQALISLFRQYGTPLVLKTDNGSHFIAHETQELLDRWNVLNLRSPKVTPSYNGSCEAGIGSLKTRAHYLAAFYDRPGQWTCDDVEAARVMANETARPWGLDGPNPTQKWCQRTTLSPVQRLIFRAAVRNLLDQARHELARAKQLPLQANGQLLPRPANPMPGRAATEAPGDNLEHRPPAGPPGPDRVTAPQQVRDTNTPDTASPFTPDEQAHLYRIAIRRVLVAHGYLRFRGRRVTLPIRSNKVAGIS